MNTVRLRLTTATLALSVVIASVLSPAAHADNQLMPIERMQTSVNATFEKHGLPTVPWQNAHSEEEKIGWVPDSDLPESHQTQIDANPKEELNAARNPMATLHSIGITASIYAQVHMYGNSFNVWSGRARMRQHCYTGVAVADYLTANDVSDVDLQNFGLAITHDQDLSVLENDILDQQFEYGLLGGMSMCI